MRLGLVKAMNHFITLHHPLFISLQKPLYFSKVFLISLLLFIWFFLLIFSELQTVFLFYPKPRHFKEWVCRLFH